MNRIEVLLRDVRRWFVLECRAISQEVWQLHDLSGQLRVKSEAVSHPGKRFHARRV